MAHPLPIIINEIKTTIETIKVATVTKYIVKKNKVDRALVETTTVPCVLISNINTAFSKQQFRQVAEEYSISLMIIVDRPKKSDDTTATGTPPIDALAAAQLEIIKTLMTQFAYTSRTIIKDSFELRTSSLSNTTLQHNFGGAITCVIEFAVSALADYAS